MFHHIPKPWDQEPNFYGMSFDLPCYQVRRVPVELLEEKARQDELKRIERYLDAQLEYVRY